MPVGYLLAMCDCYVCLVLRDGQGNEDYIHMPAHTSVSEDIAKLIVVSFNCNYDELVCGILEDDTSRAVWEKYLRAEPVEIDENEVPF